jgi:hypothetical protein
MEYESPFTQNRFEYKKKNLYFLPEDQFNEIQTAGSVYIVGSRGTGKTTLLKALNWNERRINESLKSELDKFRVVKNFIGLYLRISEFEASRFEKWLKEIDSEDQCLIFSFFIDVLILRQASSTFIDMIQQKVLKSGFQDEIECIEKVLERHPFFSEIIGTTSNIGFVKLGKALEDIHFDLAFSARSNLDPLQVIQKYKLKGSGGELSRSVAELFIAFCVDHSTKQSWHFKVCLDESECLSNNQQKSLNTVVRLSKDNIFYIVSYVREREDLAATLIPNMDLSKDDRLLVKLEDPKHNFQYFAEGVATVRVKSKLKDWNGNISIKKMFGELSINTLLDHIAKKSEGKTKNDLLKNAELLFEHPVFKKKGSIVGTNTLPIYEAYILAIEKIQLNGKEKNIRALESEKTRKKMVMAYLNICSKELKGTKPLYAYDRMLIGLSDSGIREFLSIMNDLFLITKTNIDDFVNTENIDIRIQDKVFKESSKKKFDGLHSVVKSPQQIAILVEAVARLTYRLQTSGDLVEYGKFEIYQKAANEHKEAIFSLVREAGEFAYLKILEDSENRISFRIHNSLAAHFSLSYRPSYYSKRISIDDIVTLLNSEKSQLDNTVKKITKKLLKTKNDSDVETNEQIEF